MESRIPLTLTKSLKIFYGYMQPRAGMWPFNSEGVNLMGGNIG